MPVGSFSRIEMNWLQPNPLIKFAMDEATSIVETGRRDLISVYDEKFCVLEVKRRCNNTKPQTEKIKNEYPLIQFV